MAADPEDTEIPEYIFSLPDGVESRLRYQQTGGQPLAQFRVPNRNVASNVAWSLAACAQRVASTFETAHTILEFTDTARASFLGYQTLLNVRANAAAKARVTYACDLAYKSPLP